MAHGGEVEGVGGVGVGAGGFVAWRGLEGVVSAIFGVAGGEMTGWFGREGLVWEVIESMERSEVTLTKRLSEGVLFFLALPLSSF